MYLTSKIEIDPSQMTIIKRIKNDNVLTRIVDTISRDKSDSKIELETFTVVSILDQIRRGLISLEIDNIIRLSLNGFDFYIDTEQKERDLELALKELDKKIDPIESERFENLDLVLEHQDNTFKYYIQILIERKHKVGEFPVKIITNGLVKELYTEDFDEDKIKSSLDPYFQDQESYDKFVNYLDSEFDLYVSRLKEVLSSFIDIDGVICNNYKKIIRPDIFQNGLRKVHFDNDSEPAFHGYSGINNYFSYNLYWMDFCRENNIICSNFVITDNSGRDSVIYSQNSVNAGESNLFNPKVEVSAKDVRKGEVIENGIFAPLIKESLLGEKDFDTIYQDFNYSELRLE